MSGLKRFIVGVDFSPRSLAAAEMAVELAHLTDADIELVHVVESLPTATEAQYFGKTREDLERMLIDEAQAELNRLETSLAYHKLGSAIVTGNAAFELTRRYGEQSADLLVVGNVGAQSMQTRKELGVTAYRLVEQGPDKVLVVKPTKHTIPEKVVAAIGYLPTSDEVFRTACNIAQVTKAELYAVHVCSDWIAKRMLLVSSDDAVNRYMATLKVENEKRLRDFVAERICEGAQAEPVVLSGSPSATLIEFLQNESVDLVVMGIGISMRIAGFTIGSTTHAVINQTMSSVLVIRAQ